MAGATSGPRSQVDRCSCLRCGADKWVRKVEMDAERSRLFSLNDSRPIRDELME